jgi:hypothetical protein
MIIPFGTMISKLLRALILTILPIPAGVYAADFLPLVGIPGVTNAGNAGFGDYINALYRLSISLAALLAVIKIVAAGAKYMLSDIVTNKESAKADIRGALLGLLIILGAFIILNTINTDITKNEFVIEDLKGADSSESRILRAQSRLAAAEAFCDANPDCEIESFVDKDWCDARKGQFVAGQWMAVGDSTVRNRCFYDPANEPGDTPPITGVTGCPTGQILTINSTTGVRNCITNTTPTDPLADDETTTSFPYICTLPSPGCLTIGDPSWSKDGAYASCDALGGSLADDPARLGFGICTHLKP